jgi:phosphohistidine phosphatase
MHVLVVRHGIAMDREDAAIAGIGERDRPLTPRGRDRMKRAARGLARRAPGVLSIVTSPLRRAVETAEILGRAYQDAPRMETPALLPEAEPDELVRFLAESAAGSPVAVVGHEPHLSLWIGYCLAGRPVAMVELRKGAACLLSFEDAPGPAKGRLIWLAPPSFLRRLARR